MLFTWWYQLYSNQTDPELALEPAIAALGKRYRSQHLFAGLRHIADFALLDDKIIIEVDGASHGKPEQIVKDARHTLALMKMGWRVVRCTNEEAVAHPFVTVAECLGERLTHLPTQAELEAVLLRYPAPPVRVSKRRGRKPKPARATALKKARKAANSQAE